MSEEEPKPASSVSGEPSLPREASAAAAAPADAGADPAGIAPPAPVNKVHEWTAAAVLVVLLTLVLVGFVFFMRGASI